MIKTEEVYMSRDHFKYLLFHVECIHTYLQMANWMVNNHCKEKMDKEVRGSEEEDKTRK